MVEVRVGDHDRVEPGGIEREWNPVPFAKLLHTLEESAIQQHRRPIGFDQVTAAGHGTDTTE